MDVIWELELIASSMSIGTHLEVDLKEPKEQVHIGEEWGLEMGILVPDGSKPPVLKAKTERGLSLTVRTILPDRVENGRALYVIPVSITDPPGSGQVRVLVKGEEYFATLGMGTLPLEVLPRRVLITLPGAPLSWNGTDDIPLRIRLVSPGDERVKGTLQVEAYDDGGKVPVTPKERLKPSFKGEAEYTIPLEVHGERDGGIGIKVIFRTGRASFEMFRDDAVVVSREDEVLVDVPGVLCQGSDLSVAVSGDPDISSIRASLRVNGEWTGLEMKGAEGGICIFRVPEDLKGAHEIKLELEGREVHRGDLLIEETAPVGIKSAYCIPGTSVPGSSVRVELTYGISKGKDDMKAVVRLGSRRTVGLTLEMAADGDTAGAELHIPESFPEGQQPMEVSVFDGEKRVLRELFPRALVLRSDSTLAFDLATPQDLRVEKENSDLGSYLLPDEKVVSSGRTGDLEVFDLSSGRRLYGWQGAIAHGRGWSNDRDDQLRSAAFSHFLLDMLLRKEPTNALTKVMERSSAALYRMDADPTGPSFLFDGQPKDLKGHGRTRKESKKGLCRSIMRASDEGGLYGYRGPEKDIVDLSGMIEGLLGGEMKEPLRSGLEKRIMKMKGSREGPEREDVRTALGATLVEMERGLKELGEIDRGNADLSEVMDGAGSLVLNLVLCSLVRIEMLSSWTNEAMSVWSDLRVQRQRYLKKEINRLLELASLLDRLVDTVSERLVSYRMNMHLRNTLERLSYVEIVPRSDGIFGPGGEVWRGSISLRSRKGEDVTASAWIHLPSSGWHLISPEGEPDGQGYAIGQVHVPKEGAVDIELECRPPSSPGPCSTGIIFMMPSGTYLEVEP